MPRKVNRGIDYDDDYDDYEDYDYDDDYDYNVETNAKVQEPQEKTNKPVLWSCSICTYDNEESMSVCDICGVIRKPVAGDFKSSNKKTAPFKFDVPSPDEIVSSGLRSSKTITKGNIKPSTIAKENGTENAHSTIQTSESSSKSRGKQEISRGRDGGIAGKNSSKNEILSSQPSDEASSSSSQTKLKEKHGNWDDDFDGGSAPTNNLRRMALSEKTGNLIAPNARRAKSSAEYKPDKWMLPDKAKDALTQLNLAIVGHVDSGKSTLSGRMLHLLGRITSKEMHKYEKEAKIQGKGSFAYAWALDESPEERERGITMNVAVAYFDSKKYHVVVLDSPGHKDFVPNMISGATQADAAILVIDASNGAFEAGLDGSKGQTKEHAQLIRSFGVEQIIVGINKMDAVGYSKDRFDFITAQLGAFLRSCGFKDSSIMWIPLSAMENQNLVAAPSDVRLSSWYRGPYLLDAIDSFQPPARDYAKPLLMPICDVIKSSSQGQVSACGKLEAGALRSGMKVVVMPSGEVGTIKSLERDSEGCGAARAGDNVSVNIQGVEGSNVMPGGVICHPDYLVGVANHLELKVLALELSIPILNGSQVEFHIHHAQEAGRVAKIVSLLDPKTGKETKRSPRCLLSKQSAVLEVVLNGPVCVEEFSNSRALGRAFLRAMGRTIAVGIVTRIIQ
ncbi:HBS1-like protein [Linum grandiflorum]